MASSSDRTGLAFRQGWSRVLGAPTLVAGVWLVMLIGALPAAWAVNTAIADQVGPSLTAQRIAAAPAVRFDQELIQCVRQAAEKTGLATRELVSGAAHDAGYVARVAPAVMIFIPCLNGISHNEAESATPKDCAAGAQVLLNAILEFDRNLAAQPIPLGPQFR